VDPSAVRRECLCNGQADAAGASGDEYLLGHQCSPDQAKMNDQSRVRKDTGTRA
jgi:hypothetical protein